MFERGDLLNQTGQQAAAICYYSSPNTRSQAGFQRGVPLIAILKALTVSRMTDMIKPKMGAIEDDKAFMITPPKLPGPRYTGI